MTEMTDISTEKLLDLNNRLEGELLFDETIKKLYATDASAYREIPLAVCFPKNESDIEILIDFAQKEKSSLICSTVLAVASSIEVCMFANLAFCS